uniref:Uncharacterized protein n=1 Tax=Lactuca sativa TaxID=4236 RepID=A0A9R1WVT8_LACSA|nr:hypothetical protein LSAT_V11C900479440 [Lactuca sativa]
MFSRRPCTNLKNKANTQSFSVYETVAKIERRPKWKEQTEGTSQSSGSKRLRNPDATSQQSDGRTHIDINDNPLDLENDQPLRRPVGRSKAKKAASTSSNSSVMDMVDDKFDRYVQLQENEGRGDDSDGTKNDRSIMIISRGTNDAPNKNRYENLENESGRPRGRRLGTFPSDERIGSSPT